jgi:hypothetical protein
MVSSELDFCIIFIQEGVNFIELSVFQTNSVFEEPDIFAGPVLSCTYPPTRRIWR